MSLSPIEVAMQIIPTLTEDERQELRRELGLPTTVPICAKNGHKFKLMGTSPGGWFRRPSASLFCEKCAYTVRVDK